MPKMKSKRALMKRIKLTGTGKVVRHHAYVSHLAPHKTTKQKRHLMKSFSSLNKEDTRIWQELKVAQSHTPVVKEF